MNILFLSTHLNIGGISSYLLTLGKGLKKRSHNLYIASSGGQLENRVIEEGMEFIRIPIKTKSEISPKILFSFIKLSQLLKEKDINIIHAHTRVTQVLASWLCYFSHIPYVSTCHGFFRPHFWRKVFPLWGEVVIAISDSVKEHLIKDFGIIPQKIRLIYNGIDLERFGIAQQEAKREAKEKLGLRDGPVVGIISRLSDVKGHIYLISAMKLIFERVPNAQLLIVGEGKEKKNLIEKVKKLGIEKNTIFMPSVENTSSVLSAMDLFVMPSLQEGLGLSIMEAMACGLAVVASEVGGIRNLIRDGFNGSLVKPKDIKKLYEVILELLKDKDKARLYGLNAHKTIANNFSQEKMVLETERVYSECLSASS